MATYELELLQAIADNTEAKDSFYIIVSTRLTSVVTSFSPPIIFRQRSNVEGGEYEMALIGLNTYYSFPNLDEHCNSIGIYHHGGGHTIRLHIGCYEVSSINREIWTLMGWTKETANVTIKPNK